MNSDLANEVPLISFPLIQYLPFGTVASLIHAAKQTIPELINRYAGDELQRAADAKYVIANKSQ